MTLLALTLSVGFVVDDAIVMLENIVRHIEGGMRPFEAALKGAREIGFTIISITFSLIAVFIPVLLMGGMVGRVFREFAVTIAVAIIVSGFVSLTLTPMLCARVLRAHQRGREAERRAARVRGDVQRLAARLRMVARQGACRYKFVTLLVTFGTLGRTVWLYIIIPERLLPDRGHRLHLGIDRGRVRYLVRADGRAAASRCPPSSARIQAVDYVNSRSARAARIRRTISAACSSRSSRGRSAAKARPPSSSGCAAPPIPFPAWRVYFQNVQNINITGRIYQERIPVHAAVERYRAALSTSRRDCATRSQRSRACATSPPISTSRTRRSTIEIDREKAAVYGITIDQIRQELFNAFGARQVATIYTPTNDYQVILESQPRFQADPTQLSKIYRQDQPCQDRCSGPGSAA